MQKSADETPADAAVVKTATFSILVALSFSHFLNDLIQSLLPAIYPIIKEAYRLDFGQIGLITFTFQMTASLFQPLVGAYTDKHPQPYSLVAGMASTLVGLLVLAQAGSYPMLILGAALVGTGSSIFHPEATRMASVAAGGRHGLAQSLFQFGGQGGAAAGPLVAAWIVVPNGQASLGWFSALALIAIVVMLRVGGWYRDQLARIGARVQKARTGDVRPVAAVLVPITLLILVMFSKNIYQSSLQTFYIFYLIERFGVSVQHAQLLLFVFLISSPFGLMVGGPIGDRIGRRRMILLSIVGSAPFALLLPFANLFWTPILTFMIGFVLSSAFASILVYAIQLLPGRVGMIGGLFYGLTFGLGAIGAALLGELADLTSIVTVYQICAVLPLVGLLALWLPEVEDAR
ncbi:MAG: MFS transporter [Hyphomicrobiaceae bacterium]|jgi:FSR family fosmidomycin resistance protein-like MFS transporter